VEPAPVEAPIEPAPVEPVVEVAPVEVLLPIKIIEDPDEKKKCVYFFYNVFGDANELLRTKPDSVTGVSFACDEESEARCDAVLDKIGFQPSSLPCIAYWEDQLGEPHWQMENFDHDAKPWSWNQLKHLPQ